MRMLGILRMSPWWRGPLLLCWRGGVVVALVSATAVAVLPASAAVPFLSSSRDAILHHQIAATCPWSVGVTATGALGPADYRSGAPGPLDASALAGEFARDTRQAVTAAGRVAELGRVETTLLAALTGPTERTGESSYPIWLMYRPGATDHVQMLGGAQGNGVWVTDEYATFTHHGVGDLLTLVGPRGAVTQPISGLYRSLRVLPDQPWWCDLTSVYRGGGATRYRRKSSSSTSRCSSIWRRGWVLGPPTKSERRWQTRV